tara:strand:+ start:155 stop:400 length:246 start_codon:yes stop_codon:yes gene_type:complete
MKHINYEKSVELINSTANKFTTAVDTEIFNLLSLLTDPDMWNEVDSILEKMKSLAKSKEDATKKAKESLLILEAEYNSSVL